MRLFPIFGCIALAAVGCSDPDTLTCDWLAGPDNCYRNTAVMAASCVPANDPNPDLQMGVLAADGSTCTYANGAMVTFTPPLVLPLQTGGDMNWDFTVTDASGQLCLHYKDSGSALTLTVKDQVVKEGSTGGLGISITCPDGKTVQNQNAFNLFSCPDGGLLDLPGLFWSSSGTAPGPYYVSAGLTGVGEMSIQAFNCATQ
jgi:hypothetical protein